RCAGMVMPARWGVWPPAMKPSSATWPWPSSSSSRGRAAPWPPTQSSSASHPILRCAPRIRASGQRGSAPCTPPGPAPRGASGGGDGVGVRWGREGDGGNHGIGVRGPNLHSILAGEEGIHKLQRESEESKDHSRRNVRVQLARVEVLPAPAEDSPPSFDRDA